MTSTRDPIGQYYLVFMVFYGFYDLIIGKVTTFQVYSQRMITTVPQNKDRAEAHS